ncbi:hypothetical protein YDYSY3_16230 [Paenibacillus chitinolyticus]|uniref:hypothetical protein n=1 Tax=Paenibacillus chitinolyticus TaxID=79263 RepID=UPI0026E4C094|nr:hypothetical protein [Paenibacillus chitinolyticus]GKS10623.1 hypothetical protein YDYSY3_16230 [Paenibacillus chitinolyticus]
MTGCVRDLNLGPSGQERDELPAVTTQSDEKSWIAAKVGRRQLKDWTKRTSNLTRP